MITCERWWSYFRGYSQSTQYIRKFTSQLYHLSLVWHIKRQFKAKITITLVSTSSIKVVSSKWFDVFLCLPFRLIVRHAGNDKWLEIRSIVDEIANTRIHNSFSKLLGFAIDTVLAGKFGSISKFGECFLQMVSVFIRERNDRMMQDPYQIETSVTKFLGLVARQDSKHITTINLFVHCHSDFLYDKEINIACPPWSHIATYNSISLPDTESSQSPHNVDDPWHNVASGLELLA